MIKSLIWLDFALTELIGLDIHYSCSFSLALYLVLIDLKARKVLPIVSLIKYIS